MTNNIPFEQIVRTQLRFTGSEALSDVVGNSLVKPELRREFARRSFYLYLRTETPVDVSYHYGNADGPLHMMDPLDEYNAGIAQRHKGQDLYTNHYDLSSRVIGGAEYGEPHRGVSLLFQVVVGEYERQRLLSSPFQEAATGPLYVTHDIPEGWLKQSANRSVDYQRMRVRLGALDSDVVRRGYLADHYYISRPEAIVQSTRYRDALASDDPAA